MTTCPRCPATWTGHTLQHCPVPGCHLTFTGTTAGDMHRTGRHDTSTGPDRRRCLTVEEMTEAGMTRNRHGYWTTGESSPQWWAPRDVRKGSETLAGSPQNARGGRSGPVVPLAPSQALTDTRGDG